MANPFPVGRSVDGDRLLALRTCINFLHETNKIKITDIYTTAKVNGRAIGHDLYYQLWTSKNPRSDRAAAVYDFIHDYLAENNDISIPHWMNSLFNSVFPDLPLFTDGTNAFANCEPDTPTTELFSTYVGTYGVYRYAAHVNYPAIPYPAPGTPIVIETERDGINARVVKAALRIYQEPSSQWPLFEIHYRPRMDGPIFEINGALIPIKGAYIYFVGVESTNRTPMIIAGYRQHGNIPYIEGLVTRIHERHRIVASKVIMVKRADSVPFTKECDGINIYRENQLTDEIRDIKHLMLNFVEQYGKGDLIL